MMGSKFGFGEPIYLTFGEAITKVTAELGVEGFGELSDIDVAPTMKKKLGKDMPPYRILGAMPTLVTAAVMDLRPCCQQKVWSRFLSHRSTYQLRSATCDRQRQTMGLSRADFHPRRSHTARRSSRCRQGTNLSVANYCSCRDRCLVQASAVTLPAVEI